MNLVELLAAVADSRRLAVLCLLLEEPKTQAKLCEALADGPASPLNPGTMSGIVQPLIRAGLIRRDRPRSELQVCRPDLVRELLASATRLTRALDDEARLTPRVGLIALDQLLVEQTISRE